MHFVVVVVVVVGGGGGVTTKTALVAFLAKIVPIFMMLKLKF